MRSPATSVLSSAQQDATRRLDSPGFERRAWERATTASRDTTLDSWRDAISGRLTVRPFARGHMVGDDVTQDFFELVLGPSHPASRAAATMPRLNTGRNAGLVLLIDRARPRLRAMVADSRPTIAAHGGRLMRLLADALEPHCADVTAELRWSRRLLEACYTARIEETRRIDEAFLGGPILAPELERLMDTVPHDQELLDAEEALGLSTAQIDRICVQALDDTMVRFRRVLPRLAGEGMPSASMPQV